LWGELIIIIFFKKSNSTPISRTKNTSSGVLTDLEQSACEIISELQVLYIRKIACRATKEYNGLDRPLKKESIGRTDDISSTSGERWLGDLQATESRDSVTANGDFNRYCALSFAGTADRQRSAEFGTKLHTNF
jgi:hypothetical protein